MKFAAFALAVAAFASTATDARAQDVPSPAPVLRGGVDATGAPSPSRVTDAQWLQQLRATGSDPEYAALDRCHRLLGNAVQAWQLTEGNLAECDKVSGTRSAQAEITNTAGRCWQLVSRIETDLSHARDNYAEADRLRNDPRQSTYLQQGNAYNRRASDGIVQLRACLGEVRATQDRVAQRVAGDVFQGSATGDGGNGNPGGNGGPGTGKPPILSGNVNSACRQPGIDVGPDWKPQGPLVGEVARGACAHIQCDNTSGWKVVCPGWPRPPRWADLDGTLFACGNSPDVQPPFCAGATTTVTPKPTPPNPPLQAGVERVCDMRKLAAYASGGYYDDRPVATVRVTNGTNPNTYLVLLSGMHPRLGSSTNLPDALIALFNIQGLDSYRLSIMDAVGRLPRGSTLILVGHSQGGMEAQNAAHNLVERWRFQVPQIITFGAPVSTWKQHGTSYLHLRERRDPVPAMDRMYDLTSVRVFDAPGNVSANPWDPDGAHLLYDKSSSGLQTMAVPWIAGLKSPCIEVDLRTLTRTQAPDYFTRMFTRPSNSTFSGPRPRNPDRWWGNAVNCFWVSLAQDRMWRDGLPYYAMCERSTTPHDEMRAALVRHFGGLHLDDGLGPTAQDAVRRHDAGEITPTTRAALEQALVRIGTRPDGSVRSNGGLVFVRSATGTSGHVFNVRLTPRGVVEYVDAQTTIDPLANFTPGSQIFYYRTF